MTIKSAAGCWCRGWLGLSLAVYLAGCASPTKLPDFAAKLPSSWQHAAPATAPQAPQPDLTGWWEVFADSDLNDLVLKAAAENLTVQEAVARLQAARALAGAAGKRFLPRVAARGYSLPDPDGKASFYQSVLESSWEMDLFGRSVSSAKVATARVGQAAANVTQAKVSVAANLVSSYLSLRQAQAAAELERALVDVDRRAIGLVQRRVDLSLESRGQMDRASAALDRDQAMLAQTRTVIAHHAQQLALLLGQAEPDPRWLVPRPLDMPASVRIATTPADLLRTRPDIQAAEQAVFKAAGAVGLAEADLFPRVSLVGGLTLSAAIDGRSFGSTHRTTGLGPVIDIPLFDWGMRRDVVNGRRAEFDAALAAYRQTVLNGVAEVETALADWQAGVEIVSSADRAVAMAQRTVETTDILMRNGLADGLAGTRAERDLIRARLRHAQVLDHQRHALVSIYRALGGAPVPVT